MRPGKVDHTVLSNPYRYAYSLDGADNDELPRGTWEKFRRRLGLK
jgi:hypothetical protein